MTTDLGFFSPAAVSNSSQDDKSQEELNASSKMEIAEEKDYDFVEKPEEMEVGEVIPQDFDLANTLEIFNRFLVNDVDTINAQALDSRKYLETVIAILLKLGSFAKSRN